MVAMRFLRSLSVPALTLAASITIVFHSSAAGKPARHAESQRGPVGRSDESLSCTRGVSEPDRNSRLLAEGHRAERGKCPCSEAQFPPHPPFGHLLPGGEKGTVLAIAGRVYRCGESMWSPSPHRVEGRGEGVRGAYSHPLIRHSGPAPARLADRPEPDSHRRDALRVFGRHVLRLAEVAGRGRRAGRRGRCPSRWPWGSGRPSPGRPGCTSMSPLAGRAGRSGGRSGRGRCATSPSRAGRTSRLSGADPSGERLAGQGGEAGQEVDLVHQGVGHAGTDPAGPSDQERDPRASLEQAVLAPAERPGRTVAVEVAQPPRRRNRRPRPGRCRW